MREKCGIFTRETLFILPYDVQFSNRYVEKLQALDRFALKSANSAFSVNANYRPFAVYTLSPAALGRSLDLRFPARHLHPGGV